MPSLGVSGGGFESPASGGEETREPRAVPQAGHPGTPLSGAPSSLSMHPAHLDAFIEVNAGNLEVLLTHIYSQAHLL